MGFFSKIKEGLSKTRQGMAHRIELLVNSFTKIDEELFEQLEEILITSDLGMNTTIKICDSLRASIKQKGITDPSVIKSEIKSIMTDILKGDYELDLSTRPSVILVIGVNGVGKTTAIGKLAADLKSRGKKVILGAADTFRAAAIEQLETWAGRAGVELVKHEQGSDPAAVVFDTIKAAKSRGADVAICDTAGRLHNKKNLMDELAKISRIIQKEAEGCASEVLLVLDATTGQNAVVQAKLFSEAANITGIILTKLDGTAKGGVVISISDELDIPVKYIGVGEQINDLQPFNPEEFVQAVFDE